MRAAGSLFSQGLWDFSSEVTIFGGVQINTNQGGDRFMPLMMQSRQEGETGAPLSVPRNMRYLRCLAPGSSSPLVRCRPKLHRELIRLLQLAFSSHRYSDRFVQTDFWRLSRSLGRRWQGLQGADI